ncbi:Hypothetical predicted protein [Mytilus galloprovincialis]|uniref:Uncharacterized protein n=1 Tax=Mytilus galloprovincialis TaxID=29158 RepID=A0A8B6FSJ8_MYTGA|nr:Hypothetical predicted protein [Mytilus galloprovincialis]
MVLPPVLKKRYNLKGMKLVPVIKRIRPGQPESLTGLVARMNKDLKTENLNMEDIAQHVKVLTGEDLDEICQLSGRSDDDVGGNAVDTITKAISKFLKEKQLDNKNDSKTFHGSDSAPKREESPLSKLYPQFQNPLMYSMYQPNYLPQAYQGVQPYGNFTAGVTGKQGPWGLGLDSVLEGTKDTTIGDSFVKIPEWELESGFDPLNVTVREKPAWLTLKGRVPSLTNLSPRAEEVYHDNVLFDIDYLQLRDPDKFVTGQLHNCVSEWRLILDKNAHQDVVKWLKDGVDVGEFFRRFKGNFKERNYDSEIPPRNVCSYL